MADPTKYHPDYSYVGFQQEQQDFPFPGSNLDNDLANIAGSIDQTIDALKDVRRADGALQNGIVTADSLSIDLVKQLQPELGAAVEQAAQSAQTATEKAGEAANSASAALESANTATDAAGDASTQAARAEEEADRAELAASSVELPVAVANTWLRRNAANTAYDTRTDEQARADIGADDASNLTKGTVPAAQIPGNLTPDKAFQRGNILGTVSQSGGVPTGAVIERGSNANGEYVRFADGTQICTRGGVVDLDSANVNFFFDFPAAFAEERPAASMSWENLGSSAPQAAAAIVSTDETSWRVRTTSGGGGAGALVFLSAIGRWF